jgi:sulfate transport system permease protein
MRERELRGPLPLILLAVVLVYAAGLLLAPMAAIVSSAFAGGVGKVINALLLPDVIMAFRMTFLLALGAMLINTIAGTALAWVLVRHNFPGKRLVDALVDAPFVFSPVIVGYALILMFGREGWFAPTVVQIAFAWPAMLLATVFVSLPFVTREIQPVLAELTLEQENAAYTLGATRWTTFRRVVVPQIWHGLLYGMVLTFARSVGEFGAVAVAGGAIERYTETATIYVFRAMHDRNPIGAYSVSVALGVLSIGILVVMSLLRRHPSNTAAD